MSLQTTEAETQAAVRQIINNKRCRRAGRALRAFRGGEDADEADFRDLLANLMHYASKNGYDFDREMATARRNYEAEI